VLEISEIKGSLEALEKSQANLQSRRARKADVSKYERSYKEKTLTAEDDKELSRPKFFCKVTPISAGQPTVICDDPIVSKHPKFSPGN